MENFKIESLEREKSQICRQILQSLPAWFGLPHALENYAKEVADLPVLVCKTEQDFITGFIALKQQTPSSVEAYVLGVRSEWHRRGCGRLLFNAAEAKAKNLGAKFLTVKTLADSNLDPHYKKTRLFYDALGFSPVEVFPALWSPEHPCLLMLKPL